MAFRGVLLQLDEGESSAAFRVVAPDAALTLPPRPAPARESFLTRWSQQKLVVADAVSHKLLQVARLATASLQCDERSVLWAVSATFAATPKTRTVGATPLETFSSAVPAAVSRTHVLTASAGQEDAATLAAAVASPHVIAKAETPPGRTLRATAGATRVCFCFHFRSDFEYELFARAVAAFTRMQRYALLQSSVVMEIEISREHKRHKQEESARLQAATSKAQRRQQRLELLKAKKEDKKEATKENKKEDEKEDKKDDNTESKFKAKTARISPKVTATPALKMACILCRIERKPDAPEYPKHPFVLKDGKGEVVHICKVCLQRVLQQRLGAPPAAKKGSPDNYCGLCAQSTNKMPAKSIKVCAHKVCTRVYCVSCIDKLIGKAQAHKVWRTKNWLCPNCSTDEGDVAAPEETKDAQPVARKAAATEVAVAVAAASAPKQKQKKRKRRNEIEESTADEEEGEDEAAPPQPDKSASGMQPIDYAVTYFKFLLEREAKAGFKESEDVCFCCKDGGDVLECDWKGMNGAFERCPKVYHEGYEVPEGKTWVCPRHRCQDCGIIAQYSCRFCVTSYCQDHLPKVVKRLGPATKDIPTSRYILCPRCTQQADDALSLKKIGPEIHSKVFRRRR